MRPIDADKLKADLFSKSFYPAIVAAAIERAPTINPYEWISVEDRLPLSSNTEYLVYIPRKGYYPLLTVARYSLTQECWIGVDGGTYYYKQPTHWMSLPLPPTEKENGYVSL